MFRPSHALMALTVVLAMANLSRGEDLKKVFIDDCESLEVSQKVWKMDGVTAEASVEHATGGKACLKLTFSKEGGAIYFGSKDQPMDWSHYKSIGFVPGALHLLSPQLVHLFQPGLQLRLHGKGQLQRTGWTISSSNCPTAWSMLWPGICWQTPSPCSHFSCWHL